MAWLLLEIHSNKTVKILLDNLPSELQNSVIKAFTYIMWLEYQPKHGATNLIAQ